MKPYAKAQTIPLDGLEDRRRRLTEAQKAEIRDLYAKGDIGMRSLASLFGVSRSLISILVNPERAAKVKARGAAHWKDYRRKYGKDYAAAAARHTKNYKYRVYLEKAQASEQ